MTSPDAIQPVAQRISDIEGGAKLARRLDAPLRKPLLIISPLLSSHQPHINPLEAARRLPNAEVVLLDGLAVDEFNRLRDKEGAWNGSVRAFLPGGRTRWWGASLFPPEEMLDRICAWIDPKPVKGTPKHPLLDRIAVLENRVSQLEEENKRLREKPSDSINVDDAWFADPAQAMDLRIRLAWARRIPAGDKETLALPAHWSYSESFFQTIPESLDPMKTADIMVEALTGLDASSPARRLHMLRRTAVGGSGYETGDWGKPIWRSSYGAYATSPSLHYTRDDRNDIVFLEAGLHDDNLAGRTAKTSRR